MAIKSFTSDKEINAWRLQYPSIALTRRLFGNRDLAAQYRGEADKLLYQLKNQMQFQQLGQLKMTRLFVDGTVIIAWSIFGQDFIDTDVRKTIVEVGPDISIIIIPPPKCSITLFNLPDVVQPMRYPGEIRFGEVEGTDYIKTYYEVDFSTCSECTLKWNMLGETCSGENPFQIYKLCNPFIFHDDSVPLWWNDYWREYFPLNPRPDDHCIHSLWANCGAEIIQFGKDGDGKAWFKWKAYTEYGYTYPLMTQYTRTGYGIMELLAFAGNRLVRGTGPTEEVYFEEGSPFCHDLTRITVDCCHKNPDIRKVNLWWESLSGYQAGGPTCYNQPFMFYLDMKICKIPEVVGMLWSQLCIPRTQSKSLRVIPDIAGGCIPFEWRMTGGGAGWTLDASKPYGEIAALTYDCALGLWHCQDGIEVFVEDRCGSKDSFRMRSCCEQLAVAGSQLEIIYTSLSMACNDSQDLIAVNGCLPYTWSLSGGGTLSENTGYMVVYTAPATNVNCADNPTIKVTDCCGNAVEIKLAVNCYAGGVALKDTDAFQDQCWWDAWNGICKWTGNYYCRNYDCNGTLTYNLEAGIDTLVKFDPDCSMHVYSSGDCSAKCGLGPHGRCALNPFCQGAQWNLSDVRTTEMKEQGCCPINPFTGLPY